MKILHAIAGVPSKGGGPTNALFGMARVLMDRGVKVDVATTDSDIWGNLEVPLGKRVIEQDVPIYQIPG